MFLKSKKLPFIILGTSLLIGTSVFAASTLKEIKAYLNPSIQYTLDGETILTGTQTISYQNKNYVSVAALANALGLDVTYKNNTISLSTRKNDAVTIPNDIVEDEIALDSILSNMNIISVNADENYFIVVPEGKDSTDFYDQILIRYSKDTVMNTKSGQELAATFNEGQVVTIKVGPAATLSIPPQMLALEITLEA